eukprot:g81011.t1
MCLICCFSRSIRTSNANKRSRPILKSDIISKARAQPVQASEFRSRELLALVADLQRTMLASPVPAAGLAAPQIGEDKCVFVLNLKSHPLAPNRFVAYVNPSLAVTDSRRMAVLDNCLSTPYLWGRTDRWAGVEVTACRPDGSRFVAQAAGVGAHALQHEMDHLAGALFTDFLTPGSSTFDMRERDPREFWQELEQDYHRTVSQFGGADIALHDLQDDL